MKAIKAGQEVRIRPEYQDPGDEEFRWVAIEDEDGGRVKVMSDLGLPINPVHVILVEMLCEL